MENALKNAMAERVRLKAALARVESFISNYHAFASGSSVPRAARVTVAGRPAEARAHVVASLERTGRPMTATEIIRDCADHGYVIPGKVQTSYVAIIVHRNPDIFQRVNGTYVLRRPVEVRLPA